MLNTIIKQPDIALKPIPQTYSLLKSIPTIKNPNIHQDSGFFHSRSFRVSFTPDGNLIIPNSENLMIHTPITKPDFSPQVKEFQKVFCSKLFQINASSSISKSEWVSQLSEFIQSIEIPSSIKLDIIKFKKILDLLLIFAESDSTISSESDPQNLLKDRFDRRQNLQSWLNDLIKLERNNWSQENNSFFPLPKSKSLNDKLESIVQSVVILLCEGEVSRATQILHSNSLFIYESLVAQAGEKGSSICLDMLHQLKITSKTDPFYVLIRVLAGSIAPPLVPSDLSSNSPFTLETLNLNWKQQLSLFSQFSITSKADSSRLFSEFVATFPSLADSSSKLVSSQMKSSSSDSPVDIFYYLILFLIDPKSSPWIELFMPQSFSTSWFAYFCDWTLNMYICKFYQDVVDTKNLVSFTLLILNQIVTMVEPIVIEEIAQNYSHIIPKWVLSRQVEQHDVDLANLSVTENSINTFTISSSNAQLYSNIELFIPQVLKYLSQFKVFSKNIQSQTNRTLSTNGFAQFSEEDSSTRDSYIHKIESFIGQLETRLSLQPNAIEFQSKILPLLSHLIDCKSMLLILSNDPEWNLDNSIHSVVLRGSAATRTLNVLSEVQIPMPTPISQSLHILSYFSSEMMLSQLAFLEDS